MIFVIENVKKSNSINNKVKLDNIQKYNFRDLETNT